MQKGKNKSYYVQNKIKYLQKTKRKATSQTRYLSFSAQDSLYMRRLFILRNNQFQIYLHRVTANLYTLLHFSEDDFFNELQSTSLQICLQSCLEIFPRRQYGEFIRQGVRYTVADNIDDKWLKCYQKLMHTVLIIYYRISCASKKQYKQILYNQWIFDIPKLLDLALIYGKSNPQIIKKIISNVYEANPLYDQDTLDVFGIIEEQIMTNLEIEQHEDINFTNSSLKAKNFGNRESFLVKIVMKLIFSQYDRIINMRNILIYFPKCYSHQLATDYKIQEKLIDACSSFFKKKATVWKLENYQKLFTVHLQNLRQAIVSYYLQLFNILEAILFRQESNQFYENAEDTYLTFCLLLTQKTKKQNYPYYIRIINNLIQQSQAPIFFLHSKMMTNPSPQAEKSIETCMKYERQYRQSKRKKSSLPQQFTEQQKMLIKQLEQLGKQVSINSELKELRNIKQTKRLEKEGQLPQFLLKLAKIKQLTATEYQDQPIQQFQDEFPRIRLPNQYDDQGKIIKKFQKQLDFYVAKKNSQKLNSTSTGQNLSFSFQNKETKITNLSFSILKQQKVKPFDSFMMSNIDDIQDYSEAGQSFVNILQQLKCREDNIMKQFTLNNYGQTNEGYSILQECFCAEDNQNLSFIVSK